MDARTTSLHVLIKRVLCALAFIAVLLATSAAQAVELRSIVRVKGAERNTLTGVSLVVGLNGTGDGDNPTTAAMYARYLQAMGDSTATPDTVSGLNNVALVRVECSVPAIGAREGNEFDVRVASMGGASSLEGGQLVTAVMIVEGLPDSPVFADATGTVVLENERVPTVGLITDGARMRRDIFTNQVDEFGRMTLVINDTHASLSTARNIALQINGQFTADGGPPIAEAIDASNIIITIPVWERENTVNFIAPILEIDMPMQLVEGEPVVYIDESAETIVMSSRVEVSPMGFSHPGLTLTVVNPPAIPDPLNPVTTQQPFHAVDPSGDGGADLQNLLAAFNQLGLDARDRIEIVKAMNRAGLIHARVVVE